LSIIYFVENRQKSAKSCRGDRQQTVEAVQKRFWARQLLKTGLEIALLRTLQFWRSVFTHSGPEADGGHSDGR